MDVKQNPGPLSGSDKDDILNAIRLRSDMLKAEIQCLKNDLSNSARLYACGIVVRMYRHVYIK